MPTTCVIGVQWGDEGKGKIVDLLSEKSDMIVRYQGGANAGHTVVVKGRKVVLHHVPSGILHANKICVIAHGVVLDPQSLFQELDDLRKFGVVVGKNLLVSDRAHLVMPYHKVLDAIWEGEASGAAKIGTTLRGIGPCYTDKVARKGLRVVDLMKPRKFRARLEEILREKNKILRLYGRPPLALRALYDESMAHAARLRPMVAETVAVVHDAVDRGKNVLFEGAQGAMLDIDLGTYPYVTSSNSDVCGVSSGTGIPPKKIGKVIGVAKAYCTRVGGGPFPTEMEEEQGNQVRQQGAEYGATTGRPRRCGWFDGVASRFAVRINGIDEMVITKMDVLSAVKRIRFARRYSYRGRMYDDIPADTDILESCRALYDEFPGWEEDISAVRRERNLPAAARRYLAAVERFLGCPISIVSVGSDREANIIRK